MKREKPVFSVTHNMPCVRVAITLSFHGLSNAKNDSKDLSSKTSFVRTTDTPRKVSPPGLTTALSLDLLPFNFTRKWLTKAEIGNYTITFLRHSKTSEISFLLNSSRVQAAWKITTGKQCLDRCFVLKISRK